MSSDLRQALRFGGSRKSHGLLLVATLACGIAAPTVALSVADTVIWHPLPFRNAERLVRVTASAPPAVVRESPGARATLTGLFPFAMDAATIDSDSGAEAVTIGELSPGLLDALGVAPARGRGFAAADFTAGSNVVLVSAALGSRLRAATPDADSFTLRLDGVRQSVVGIMPEGFDFPVGRVALWRPLSATPAPARTTALGVLGPGVSLGSLTEPVTSSWPGAARVAPFAPVSAATLTGVGTLVGAGCLLFLIAMTNVAGLHIAAAAGRESEFAVRRALGASPGRLARAVLIETWIATASAAILALPLALWGLAAVVRGVPYLLAFRTLRPMSLNVRALVIMTVATAAIGALASWWALVRARRVELQTVLRAQAHGLKSRSRARRALSAAAIAVTVPIVTCAALLTNSLVRLIDLSPGFPTDRVLQLIVDLPRWRYSGELESRQASERLREALRALPAVEAVSRADGIPPAFDRRPLDGFVVDGTARAFGSGFVSYDAVDAAFFRTLDIPILVGRSFDSRDVDGAESVAIVSRSLADRLWPGGDALGRRFSPAGGGRERTVVGIAANVINVDSDRARGTLAYYLPGAQSAASAMTLFIIKTRTGAVSAASAVRDAVRHALPDAPVIELGTIDEMIADDTARERFLAGVVGVIALAALGLALVGVYAMFWTSVRERTREIGVRLALGATPSVVMRTVLGSSARVALAGLAVGLPAALGATHVLRSWLFQISPGDPPTYAAVVLVVLLAALAATYGPARRAASVDPVRALRTE